MSSGGREAGGAPPGAPPPKKQKTAESESGKELVAGVLRKTRARGVNSKSFQDMNECDKGTQQKLLFTRPQLVLSGALHGGAMAQGGAMDFQDSDDDLVITSFTSVAMELETPTTHGAPADAAPGPSAAAQPPPEVEAVHHASETPAPPPSQDKCIKEPKKTPGLSAETKAGKDQSEGPVGQKCDQGLGEAGGEVH